MLFWSLNIFKCVKMSCDPATNETVIGCCRPVRNICFYSELGNQTRGNRVTAMSKSYWGLETKQLSPAQERRCVKRRHLGSKKTLGLCWTTCISSLGHIPVKLFCFLVGGLYSTKNDFAVSKNKPCTRQGSCKNHWEDGYYKKALRGFQIYLCQNKLPFHLFP